MLSSFLGKFFCSNTRRRQARRQTHAIVAMEPRTLLAGNVTAKIVGGDLQITGDDAANDIEILKTTDGVIVRGNSTTINGASTDFVAFASTLTKTGAIIADMGAGDDKVQFDGLTLDRRVVVTGGAGDDSLGLTSVTSKASVVFRGDDGNDSLVLDQTTIDGSLVVDGGAGDDLITLTGSEIKHSLVVLGREGADGLNLDNSKVDRWLIEYMGKGNDDVRIANGSTTKHVQLWGQRGDDVVQVDGSNTTRSFAARMGKGNDDVSLTGTVDLGHRVVIRGGRGTDSVSKGTATLPKNTIIRSENSSITGTVISDRLGTATGGLQNDVALAKADFVTSTFVRMATTEGNIDIELNNADAPVTVANFLNYLSRYSGTIIHRVADLQSNNFIVQGGGFTPAAITTDAPIKNEFNAANSNVRGTLAMALPSNIDGGTSQWFFNAADNSFLDSGKYTVFGTVLGTGMTVVDAIAGMTTFNISGPLSNSALTTVPLKNYTGFTASLAGAVNASVGSTTVTGIGTSFNTALTAGAVIQIEGVAYTVASITSATQLTLSSLITIEAIGSIAKVNAAPTDANYVKINSVSIIDEPV